MISTMELRTETGGPRFYADGEPIHCGDGIYVFFGPRKETTTDRQILEAHRVPFRFEWSHDLERPITLYSSNQTVLSLSVAEFSKLDVAMVDARAPIRAWL